MKIKLDLYPEGKHKAMTFSYDDGRDYDLRLAKIFDFSGMKATFHLNGGMLGDGAHLNKDEVKAALARHEISCHTYTHPHLTALPAEAVTEEMRADRGTLEEICGYPIRGMSYPYGDYNDAVIARLDTLGMRYARTIKSTEYFRLPADFMEWHPTCHHKNPRLFALLEQFKKTKYPLALFYIWGHSFEFARDDNWDLIEKFCTEAADNPDVWYATNIEIYDYITALRALSFSADCTMVYNPTATDVWITADEKPTRIAAGAVVHLNT